MIEVDQMVPVKYDGVVNSFRECLKLYYKEKWIEDLDENLKCGYEEMSELNLTLAEVGLDQDISDLIMYEYILTGREEL
ncbi:CopG family ribbon-helix-helix protein [Tissierellaceae bacterium HCP3S3_D8]